MPRATHSTLVDDLELAVVTAIAVRPSYALLAHLADLEDEDLEHYELVDRIMDAHDHCLLALCASLRSQRVWFRPDPSPTKEPHWLYLLQLEAGGFDRKFHQDLRVTPRTFRLIEREIRDHPVFGTARQSPVFIQLMLVLWRFGHNGNGASLAVICTNWSCSAGWVRNATRRVVRAVNDRMATYSSWPDAEEKERAKTLILSRLPYGDALRDTLGQGFAAIDGTLNPLFERPAYRARTYFDRKSNSSVSTGLIFEPVSCHIIGHCVGHTGSTHDSTVFASMSQSKFPARYFEPGEFMWADSAYPATATVLPTFKEPAASLEDNSRFNKLCAHIRVFAEHGVGLFKGRWASTRSLRISLNAEKDHLRVVEWLTACIHLHNFALLQADEDQDQMSRFIEASKIQADARRDLGQQVVNTASDRASSTAAGKAFRASMVQRLKEARAGS